MEEALILPDFVAQAAQLACLFEVSAEKPGNVTPTKSFHDMTYADFLRSAVAIGPEMGQAEARGVGDTILAAIQRTRQWTQANTNLGIVLLLAPLAKAALMGKPTHIDHLRAELGRVLTDLTIADATSAYKAIRLAAPGGIEAEVDHDVRAEPTITLREAMATAVERDNIAAEYFSNYAITFEQGVPALQRALAAGVALDQAIVYTFLSLLATIPDTLIVRKQGQSVAQAVSTQAADTLRLGSIFSDAGYQAIQALDDRLRQASNNQLNPGTTADLVAATLFVAILLKQIT